MKLTRIEREMCKAYWIEEHRIFLMAVVRKRALIRRGVFGLVFYIDGRDFTNCYRRCLTRKWVVVGSKGVRLTELGEQEYKTYVESDCLTHT